MTHHTQEKFKWFKDHADTMAILAVFAGAIIWMNFQFNSVGEKFYSLEKEMDGKFSNIEKEIALVKTEISIVKTVLLMKNILPSELASKEEKK